MLAGIGRHLRSNVVAYLALFVALTGTAYAADKIGSKDIRKGAVKSRQIADGMVKSRDIQNGKGVRSVDVKNGSLTGADLDESSLGSVPRAGTADLALSLQGFGPAQFLGSDRILYGRQPSSADGALLIDWAEAGIEVRTHDIGAGDAIYDARILNTNPTGGSSFSIVDPGGGAASLPPGGNKKVGGLTGFDRLLVENKGALNRLIRLSCFANVISGGDDGSFQCMAVTAGS